MRLREHIGGFNLHKKRTALIMIIVAVVAVSVPIGLSVHFSHLGVASAATTGSPGPAFSPTPSVAAGENAPVGPQVQPVAAASFPHMEARTALSCSLTEAWQMPSSPQPGDEYIASHFPPAEGPQANVTPMSQLQAVSAALQEILGWGSTVAAAKDSPLVVQEMSWSDFVNLDPSDFSLKGQNVNPNRCVWVVSVNSPMSIAGSSWGPQPESTVKGFTAVYDVATATFLTIGTNITVLRS